MSKSKADEWYCQRCDAVRPVRWRFCWPDVAHLVIVFVLAITVHRLFFLWLLIALPATLALGRRHYCATCGDRQVVRIRPRSDLTASGPVQWKQQH